MICKVCLKEKPLEKFQKSIRFNKTIGISYIYYDKRCYSCRWEKHKKKGKIIRKTYYEKNKETIIKKTGEYAKLHKKQANAYKEKYRKKRRQKGPGFRMIDSCRNRIRDVLKGKYKKCDRTIELLGCSPNELKTHIEKQFLPGMTWDNHSLFGWHIDHIKPCASFDLSNPEEQKKCFHYTNLQPLWWEDNLKKGESYSSSMSSVLETLDTQGRSKTLPNTSSFQLPVEASAVTESPMV